MLWITNVYMLLMHLHIKCLVSLWTWADLVGFQMAWINDQIIIEDAIQSKRKLIAEDLNFVTSQLWLNLIILINSIGFLYAQR